ncbi:neocarzinostatin apoprotein domain-containing protein [Nocardia sp. NPDC050406]|uniref:neocarzinostatin apoprotein domain-containing protein n=1 Tax=Nocardia sp. NPDC050406 TaxID=3364318 RepID=UPI00379EDB20
MIRSAAARLAAAVAIAALPMVATLPAAHAESQASIQVSASSDLTEGQRITVDGSGFRPGLSAVAVGLCKQGFTNGLKDCDLEGGATFVNISDDGGFPTVTITARRSFNAIDCTKQQCVIAAAPLPGTEPDAVIAANSAEIPVTFAGANLPVATAPATTAAVRSDSDIEGPSTVLWAATAALLSIVAVIALADRRRL